MNLSLKNSGFVLVFVMAVYSMPLISGTTETTMGITTNLEKEYSKDFTDLIELVYGKDLLSQGGSKSIDAMFKDVPMVGTILDIGSGLGGVDLYLASKYSVNIIGMDAVPRMVADANQKVKEKNLRGTVVFKYQNPSYQHYPFSKDSFDIVFSKEALLHVADKKTLLQEVFRVLKPGGYLVILDWLVPSHQLGKNIKKMLEMTDLELKMATLHEYEDDLRNVGFTNISSLLMNQDYVDYTGENIEDTKRLKQDIIKLFDEEKYTYSLDVWGLQKKVFEDQEVLVTLLQANKPY